MRMLEKRLLDAKSAACYLSISRALLYQWVQKNRIKSLKINGRRLFDINDLDEFVDNIKSKGF